MKVVRGFFRFWYDFFIGDDWRIAFTVVVGLTIGGVLVARETISDQAIAVLFLVGLITALLVSLRIEARKQRP